MHYPFRTKYTCTDGEQSQNVFHTSLVVRSQERYRVLVGGMLVQEMAPVY